MDEPEQVVHRRELETPAPEETHEEKQSLPLLAASPLIWAAHFLATYLTAAIWCAKFASRDDALGWVRGAIGVYTAVALAGIGLVAWIGFQRHTFGESTAPHDFDSPEDRHRFLGLATLLLSGLSAVATIYVALVAVFTEWCH